MKLIQISDIHLTIPGEPMDGLDPHKRFATALQDVTEKHSDAERIIITGDLTHWADPQAYQSLSDALANIATPVRLMIGNHDDRAVFLNAFPEHPTDPFGYVNYFEDLDDTRLIYLDTVAHKTHEGHFSEDRANWLNEALKDAEHARLFMHHNPMKLGLPAVDKIGLVERDQSLFRTILETYRSKIDYIHFGHVHAPIHGTYCGIPFASVPSTGNQAIPDLNETELLKGGPLPPAYFVICLEGRDTVIHQIPYTWAGPISTAGTRWEDWAKPLVLK